MLVCEVGARVRVRALSFVYLSILRQRSSQSPLSLSAPLDVITMSSQIPVLGTAGIIVRAG